MEVWVGPSSLRRNVCAEELRANNGLLALREGPSGVSRARLPPNWSQLNVSLWHHGRVALHIKPRAIDGDRKVVIGYVLLLSSKRIQSVNVCRERHPRLNVQSARPVKEPQALVTRVLVARLGATERVRVRVRGPDLLVQSEQHLGVCSAAEEALPGLVKVIVAGDRGPKNFLQLEPVLALAGFTGHWGLHANVLPNVESAQPPLVKACSHCGHVTPR